MIRHYTEPKALSDGVHQLKSVSASLAIVKTSFDKIAD
jgi:hypothetical protein